MIDHRYIAINFAKIKLFLVTGTTRKFLNVSQSRSVKNSIAPMHPNRHGNKSIELYTRLLLNKLS